jgi:hypothetical protein
MLILKLIQGEHERYCKPVMFRRNVELVKRVPLYRPVWLSDPLLGILLSLGGLGVLAASRPSAWLGGVLVIGAGWVFGLIDELRVFTAALPWIVYGFLSIGGVYG